MNRFTAFASFVAFMSVLEAPVTAAPKSRDVITPDNAALVRPPRETPLTPGAESQFEFEIEHFDLFGYPMHVVHRGSTVSELPRAELPLDVHYQWNGDHTLEELLARTDTTGFIVLQNGKIVYERYFMAANQNSRFLSYSVTKSFTSTLVGLAIADGKIASVNQPVIRYLPELQGSGFEGASIEDLLEMSSGVKFSQNLDDPASDIYTLGRISEQGDGKVRDFLKSITSAGPPGRTFAYNDANAQVLGWLVTRVTGQSLADYMSKKLWQPLGMEQDATWMADGDGTQGLEGGSMLPQRRPTRLRAFRVAIREQGELERQADTSGRVG